MSPDKCPDVGKAADETRVCPSVARFAPAPEAPVARDRPAPVSLCRHELQVVLWAAAATGCWRRLLRSCWFTARLEPLAPTELLPAPRVLCLCEAEAAVGAVMAAFEGERFQ